MHNLADKWQYANILDYGQATQCTANSSVLNRFLSFNFIQLYDIIQNGGEESGVHHITAGNKTVKMVIANDKGPSYEEIVCSS